MNKVLNRVPEITILYWIYCKCRNNFCFTSDNCFASLLYKNIKNSSILVSICFDKTVWSYIWRFSNKTLKRRWAESWNNWIINIFHFDTYSSYNDRDEVTFQKGVKILQ